MSKPSKNDIALVLKGFEEFFEHMVKTQSFNLQEFVNFMEPKFEIAGYRNEPKYNFYDNSGGEYTYFNRKRCW